MHINKLTEKGLRENVKKGAYGMQRGSLPLLSVILFTLVLTGCLAPNPLPIAFPTLCSGNFQSVKTTTIPALPTILSSDKEEESPTGLSVGATIFDRERSNKDALRYKLQAAQATSSAPQNVVALLGDAIRSDSTDAEAHIYLENWRVLVSNHPHLTIVVGVNFTSSSKGGSRSILQGAYTAQKECNDQNHNDTSKTQIVLMIANIGGNNPDDRAKNAKFVADQIFEQAKDPTIVGIMGWLNSAESINVNYQLKTRGSILPMVSPSSSSDELEGMSNFFRVCPRNSEQTKVVANFLLKTKQKRRIAILYGSTTSYSTNMKNDLIKESDVENNIVGSESYIGNNEKTLQDALTKVLEKNPDAIFFAGYESDLAKLLNALPQSNNLLIFGGDALATTNTYTSLPPSMNRVYFTAFASPSQWDSTNLKPPFFQKYEDNFKKIVAPTGLPAIDATVMLGYDATLALLHSAGQILSKQNTITPDDLTQALKQITGSNAIQGVTGRIAFDSNGDQDGHKMVFVEHIEGKKLVIDETHGCLGKDQCGS